MTYLWRHHVLTHNISSVIRLFYQNNNDSDERGIEYDRLIELPEVDDRSTGRTPAPKLVLNERERHLISNRLYSEYAEDQERFNRLADDEVGDIIFISFLIRTKIVLN